MSEGSTTKPLKCEKPLAVVAVASTKPAIREPEKPRKEREKKAASGEGYVDSQVLPDGNVEWLDAFCKLVEHVFDEANAELLRLHARAKMSDGFVCGNASDTDCRHDRAYDLFRPGPSSG